MYVVPVEVKKSSIDGKGVFAKETIAQGSIVWQYTEGHDKKISVEDFAKLSDSTRELFKKVGYLSEQSGKWVMPPENDAACFTNHSINANTASVFNSQVSDELVFVATRDIKAGEEITNNYLEFDQDSKPESFDWL